MEVCIQLRHAMLAVFNENSVYFDKTLKVHTVHNCPGKSTWTTSPSEAYDLLQRCLELNPTLQITVREALNYPFLQNIT